MTERFKIVFIGAGSFRFSTYLFQDLAWAAGTYHLPLEIGLCDIDPTSLQLMTRYFGLIARRARLKLGVDVQITAAVHPRELLANADCIFKSISVGTTAADWWDIFLPYKFGIPQNTGDTVGPGGIFRALRTIPFVAELIADIRALCPKALVLNYSNPQAPLVLAAHTLAPDIQFLGLCHELFDGMRILQRLFRERFHLPIRSWEDMEISYAGINHCGWITQLRWQGRDLYDLLRNSGSHLEQHNYRHRRFNYHLLNQYQAYCYPSGRHVAEFLPAYYNYFNHKTHATYWNFPQLRDVALLESFRRWVFRLIRTVVATHIGIPPPTPSPEKAMHMALDWRSNASTVHVVNVPNLLHGRHLIPQLPADCVVEIPARFQDSHIHPRLESCSPLNPEITALLHPHCELQRRLTAAVLARNREELVKVMQADPLCAFIEDPARIEALTDWMLFFEQRWLPEEWKDQIPTETTLAHSAYPLQAWELIPPHHTKVKYPPNPALQTKAWMNRK